MSLYRKYRPQTFANVTGQEAIITTIVQSLKDGTVNHAYCFSGPRGIGKTTTARLLAKALNCLERPSGSGEPCNTCGSCQEITSGNAVDVLEIDAASNTGVENVRENIIANARITPLKSKNKIFIIDEVHMLSTQAFNALLKTIEEPPANVYFILATTERHKIPETILSRCQRYEFRTINAKEMRESLLEVIGSEGRVVEEEVVDNIIRSSEGCLRDALNLLEQLLSISAHTVTQQEASLVLPRSDIARAVRLLSLLTQPASTEDSIKLIGELMDDGIDMDRFIDDCLEVARVGLLLAIAGKHAQAVMIHVTPEQLKDLNSVVEHSSAQLIIRWIKLLLKAREDMRWCSVPQLPLEMAVVEYTLQNPGTKAV